ncbi:MAG: pyridoxamine 5-phosphate oxidase [Microvirga sp.]|jgi:general stress protein 26|nr:pyridoxamine 5-phosphate oxidase [Microvirga sp.]
MPSGQNDPNAQKLFDLIKDLRICMMTTAEPDHSLHSRPMYSMAPDENGRLWFFTKLQSPKVVEISKDRQVNLAYSDPDSQHYVSISGVAEVVREKATIDEKWSEGLRAWFPDGKDDPSIALIRVKPIRGEYWDSPSSTFVQLYGSVKAALTGQPATEIGEQRKVSLR